MGNLKSKTIHTVCLYLLISLMSSCFNSGSEDQAGGGLFDPQQSLSLYNHFSITLPDNKTYLSGEKLQFHLSHPYPVTVEGTPTISFTVGAGQVLAPYVSGSGSNILRFEYTVATNDLDTDGISVTSNINLNGGSFKITYEGVIYDVPNSLTIGDTTGILIGIPPSTPTITISSAINILANNKTNYSVLGNCSEDFETVTVNIESLTFSPKCSGGSYTTGVQDVSSLSDGPITITADHSSATTVTTSIYKDTSAPSLVSNSITANTYSIGDTLTLTLNFNQNVIVTGFPRIELSFNSQASNPVYATYSSGSNSSTLVFTYIVAAGDADPDGINVNALYELNGGTIIDSYGNPASPNLVTTSFPSVIIDSAVPSITSFIEPVNATYPDGVGLLFQVNFNEPVNITGTPRIAINLGGSPVYATYKTGTGTSGLEFEYIIQPGDADLDGITLNATSIELNSGTIKGLDNDDAVLEFGLHLSSMSGVIVNTATGITAPNQVTNLTTAPTLSNTELALSWGAPNDNGFAITHYSVQYRQQGNSTWINSSPNPTTNATTVTGLTAGITYEFRVAADNGLLGAYSSTQTAQIFDILSMNPIAWLSSTNVSGGGVEPNNNDKVSTWVDLTGTATDAIESNPADQPTYKTNVQNGLPAIYFDGTHNKGLEGTFVRTNNGGLTIFLVGQFSGTARRAFFEFYRVGGGARGFFFTYGYSASTSQGLDNTQFNVWSAYDNGTQSDFWENGTSLYLNKANYSGYPSTAFTGNGAYVLGDDQTGGDRLTGYLGEFLIFDRQLTTTEMTNIETYLKNKWGTP